MKFVDEVFISVQSGKGGRGSASFRREKFIPKGGPDGGDGGKGGDVIFKTLSDRRTLYQFRFKREFNAKNGQSGGGNLKTGKSAEDLIIEIPPGTIISDAESNEIIIELLKPNETFIIAKGGRGGKGNKHFATSTNRSPRFVQEGEPCEAFKVKLELKLISDVGIIGLPNAGKSTLLSVLSAKKAKIGDYPFTTLEPNLGVVETGYDEPFIAADIPGLIEGSHTGSGLGIQFLKHIEKTRLLIHLVDASLIDPENPRKNYDIINNELRSYSPSLCEKPQIVVLTKTDIEGTDKLIEIFQSAVKDINIICISAHLRSNLNELKSLITIELKHLTQIENIQKTLKEEDFWNQ